MLQITVSHDGTLTREGARTLRAHGAPITCTGSTTLAQARKIARALGGDIRFVSATRPQVRAKATRKAAAPARKATAWACGHTSLREHISARCNGKAA